ncbi:ABC transporter permease [Pannonibacter carbonis]|uniref:ABC transporter permease n=1 Tax=Pannonibacter carbonis TaxID=2067569 RepID=UPI000D10E390|nr:ABC transporter permease [Pannonibacter carbonis]
MTALDPANGAAKEASPASVQHNDTPQPVPRAEEASDRLMRLIIPAVMLGLLVLLWAWYVSAYDVPHYILPSPWRVAQSLVNDWPTLSSALLVTLKITFMALGLALAGGVGLAIIMTQSRWVELAIYPYAVILQVTPIVAIAPLIVIYAPTTQVAVLICAFIVAFFPVLSNTTQGLKSTDHNLLNLFEMYGASRWQTLRYLKLPAALPYFLAGLKIAGGLALIAAVVAEFAAGSAGANSGLAYRLLESQFRLNIPRLFAALLLLSLTGVLIFALTSAVSHLLLRRWHESAIRREN